MIPNEQLVITEARLGSHQAYNRLVMEYQESALMLAYRLLRNRQDAEDIVQNAFIKVWEELSTFRGDSKFSSWLYRIVYNLSLNRIKSRSLRTFLRISQEYDEEDYSSIEIPDDNENPEEVLIRNERKELLEKAVKKLPTKQRAIFVMRMEQGLTNSEIAEITGKSEGSVKANFSFALAKLKIELSE